MPGDCRTSCITPIFKGILNIITCVTRWEMFGLCCRVIVRGQKFIWVMMDVVVSTICLLAVEEKVIRTKLVLKTIESLLKEGFDLEGSQSENNKLLKESMVKLFAVSIVKFFIKDQIVYFWGYIN